MADYIKGQIGGFVLHINFATGADLTISVT